MAAESTHFMRCLSQIHQVIGKANEILSGISRPSVCSEVLGSTPGMAYILGTAWHDMGSPSLVPGPLWRALRGLPGLQAPGAWGQGSGAGGGTAGAGPARSGLVCNNLLSSWPLTRCLPTLVRASGWQRKCPTQWHTVAVNGLD
nr:PREDICTED: uncharacterized protein LOC103280518 [Anolis carolinensis]|eukprot:XP_016852554.1 PREDICTED: uncharacterized protein LOC103280518 [Anolis carolinensis]